MVKFELFHSCLAIEIYRKRISDKIEEQIFKEKERRIEERKRKEQIEKLNQIQK